VPALNVGGWYDVFLAGTIRNFTGVQAKGATSEARDGSRLLLGPWTHSTPPSAQVGAIHYGMAQGQDLSPLSLDHDAEQLRFFDYWLKGTDDGISQEPPVKIFVMGENTWRYEAEWPLARTEYTDFFLHSRGGANSAAGDGTLSTREPADERTDTFTYDPLDPVPTVGGQLCCYPPRHAPGAFDQRSVEARPDVLVFKSEPLERDLEVTGPVILHLWAATTAADTDFTAKLVDMDSDGNTRNLTDGIIRARFRAGTDTPRPIIPGEPTNYTIDLWATSNLFRRGHRIVLEVASSNFPRFDRRVWYCPSFSGNGTSLMGPELTRRRRIAPPLRIPLDSMMTHNAECAEGESRDER
jgi:putative CocE/NonD family hydrolase